MSLLGIDVGTSGCKTVVFTIDGAPLASEYEEYNFKQPQPGWAELDSWTVWDQIKRSIYKACRSIQDDPVQAICVSSLGEATVPVTGDRQILGLFTAEFR